jgi:oligoribonuclease NrnB/cAMP/cGMP phosphodiesterase (DHH superfamily)
MSVEIKKNLIVYHKIDFDGKSAGAQARLWCEENFPTQSIELLGIDYGDQLDMSKIDQFTRVIMVDYTHLIQGGPDASKARPMYEIQQSAGEFIWLDHHGTALDAVKAYKPLALDPPKVKIEGLRNTKFSGTELTWIYLFNRIKTEEGYSVEIDGIDFGFIKPNTEEYTSRVPRIVYLLGRYDVWDLSDEKVWSDALAFQYGIRLKGSLKPENDSSFFWWKQVLQNKTGCVADFEATTISKGRVVLEYNDINNLDYLDRHGYACELYLPSATDGFSIKSHYSFFAMNTGQKGSASFNSLRGKYDAFIAYQHDGHRMSCSIYSFDPEHCNAAVLCQALGGGGHPGAAGFGVVDGQPLPFKRI